MNVPVGPKGEAAILLLTSLAAATGFAQEPARRLAKLGSGLRRLMSVFGWTQLLYLIWG